MNQEMKTVLASISDADVDRFWQDGAIELRGVVGPRWLELLAEGIEKTVANPTPYGRVQSKPDDPGWFFTDYYMWRHYEEFETVAREGPGGVIASRLLRTKSVNYFYEGLFLKEPGTVRASDWHQDQPYYNVDGRQLCVLWIPLDPVTTQTSLKVVRGSHTAGKWYQPTFFAQERVLEGAADLFEPTPDVEAQPDAFDIMTWALEPGDVIVFHPLCLHGAAGNPAPTRRRALQTVFLGDDCVYGERMVEVEPSIEGHDFKPGDRLNVETVFPTVWPRSDMDSGH
jgi:ectoine hydroxylase-related dioxygenase (phytanoyl-CoA dioxygenase family)